APPVQLPLRRFDVFAELEEAQRQPAGAQLETLVLRRRVFLPLPMLLLQRLGQPCDLTACQRRQLAPREQHVVRRVEVHEVELRAAVDRAEERRVASSLHAEAERLRRGLQWELEARRLRLELGGQAPQENDGTWPEHAEPESLHVR